MTAALTLVAAVVAVLLAVPRPRSVRLQSRLGGRAREPVTARRGGALRSLGYVSAAGVLVVAAGAARGPVGAVVTASVLVVVGTTTALVRGSIRQRALVRAQTEVAAGCDVLASYLRVGQVASEALELAAHDCAILGEAARTQQIGGDVAAAWMVQAQRPGCAGLRDLARAWRVATVTGAPLSTSLAQVAAGLAADQSLQAVVAGELSAPRATGKLMAVLPLLGIGLGYVLGGDPIGWLLAAPVGWACLVAGLGLAAVGVTWIERLARDADART